MNVLVLNCGSSSLKFQVIASDLAAIRDGSDRLLAKGYIERIGSQALVTLSSTEGGTIKEALPIRDHVAAIDHVLKWLISDTAKIDGVKSLGDIHAVGHRVVHGGERFRESVLVDERVVKGIEDCIELAPLHNPANLSGIRAIYGLLGREIPQVAVFDTSFHATMPETSFLYALPYQFYRRYKVRRYGFHGTSHRYVAFRYREIEQKPKEAVNIITLHLGNGCSACAIQGGLSIDTSMGMTPMEGLVMGTRSGDIDPAIIDFLVHKEGMSSTEIDAILNKQSGLLGISGLTNDMRELLEEEAENGDRRASLAIEIFCRRVTKYIGAYLAELGGADAICFTGGIGENAATIRERIVAGLEWLGIELDSERNASHPRGSEGVISKPTSRVKVFVIPTNEELLIARDTVRKLGPDAPQAAVMAKHDA